MSSNTDQTTQAVQDLAKAAGSGDGWAVAGVLATLLVASLVWIVKKYTKDHEDFKKKVRTEFHVLKDETTKECLSKGVVLDDHAGKIQGISKSLDKVRAEMSQEHAVLRGQLSTHERELMRLEKQQDEHRHESNTRFEKIEMKLDEMKNDLISLMQQIYDKVK